jgi:hypothetical protein
MPELEWTIMDTDLFGRQFKHFEKKKPEQLKAVLRNLARYKEMLDSQPIAQLIQANFIHNEKHGLFALTQQGYKPKQPVTRLYVYPDQKSRALYLITIGDKQTQSGDIKDAYRFIVSLSRSKTYGTGNS